MASAISSGIGDDCAVLRLPSSKNAGDDEILVTTDFSLEGIHFRRVWHSPEVVGHRCLTRGLSDVAAMGGTPVAAFLSLALPRTLAQVWIERFAKSLIGLAKRHGVVLAGGDTAESPDGILADIIVVGTVPKGRAILRSGARPGDRIFVSGELGCGVAALVEKMRGRKVRESDYLRHFYPEARLELGRALREQRLASAMIDMSDGLSTDLGHLCEESGVGAEIKADSIPRARVGRPAREVALDLALHGGDDYELLFTVRPGKHVPEKIAGVTVTEIGRITRSRKLGLRDATGFIRKLAPRGWEHFR
ncbi:MAG TPA: thiamine-phosphate kinase [Verrucomicrobiae bacterium]|nr:thiamine-phosphate kinase [Verrucomicrobiae bacterium]